MAVPRHTPSTIAHHLTLMHTQRKKRPSSRTRHPWTEHSIAGKSVWEWLSLLLVPLLLGVGTIWVTNQQTVAQNELAARLHQDDITRTEQQRENDLEGARQASLDDLLLSYKDHIDTFLFANGLKAAKQDDPIRIIAQSRTRPRQRMLDVVEQ